MLASLMGHMDIVNLLIAKGAHDEDDLAQAFLYAGEGGIGARRRAFYHDFDQEHPHAAEMRNEIRGLLSSPGHRAVLQALERSDLGYLELKMAKKGTKIVVYAPILTVDTRIPLGLSKTVGTIGTKHSGKILKVAHSGWRTDERRDSLVLDTEKWNHLALRKVATLLRFHFPGNQRDNGALPAEVEHRGRAHAGHVEVLLAPWYAVAMLKKHGGPVTTSCGAGSGERSDEELVQRLRRLRSIRLGRDRHAVITIDSEPCRTCLQFVNRLANYTGLSFDVKESAGVGPIIVRIEGRRRRDMIGNAWEDSDNEEIVFTPGESENEDMEDPPVVPQPTSAPQDPIPNEVPYTGFEDSDDSATLAADSPIARRSRYDPWPREKPAAAEEVISRVPENQEELVAEYRKKTPVWEWPGYEARRPSRTSNFFAAREDEVADEMAFDTSSPESTPNDQWVMVSHRSPNSGEHNEEPQAADTTTSPPVPATADTAVAPKPTQSFQLNRFLYQPATEADAGESVLRQRFPFLNLSFSR
ncbi:hypothetical protein F4780DRAFT_586849 [Xylariomycetidae sp. FL0641]|nr:hypothetical protein F4780DRAFT_586849 [Xylariomycetidae sp. FL0641]